MNFSIIDKTPIPVMVLSVTRPKPEIRYKTTGDEISDIFTERVIKNTTVSKDDYLILIKLIWGISNCNSHEG